MTASSTGSPRKSDTVSFILVRTCAEISWGEASLSPARTQASPFSAASIPNGAISAKALTSPLSNLRPMPRVGDGLTLGDLADELLAHGGEGDDRMRGAIAFRVGDDLGLTAVEEGDARVRRPEVDPDDLSHDTVGPSPLRAPRVDSTRAS